MTKSNKRKNSHNKKYMEYKAKYNPNKPQISFMNYSGMYINTVLGTVFLLTGIGVLFIGILLKFAGL